MKFVHKTTDPHDVAVQRAGALLMELMAATALFGIVLALAVPIIGSVGAIRAQTHQRQFARIELANVMERIAAGHRAGVPLQAASDEVQLSPEAAELLPEADLAIDVTRDDELSGSMRVKARLSWTGEGEQAAAPVELTAFFVEAVDEEAVP